MFNYGNFKLFLFKISIGILLICFSSFLLISILTHSLSDPGIGKLSGAAEIKNFFGLWGAISSSILLILIGKTSLIFIVFLFYLGFLLGFGFQSKHKFLKTCLIILSSVNLLFETVIG